MANLAVFLVCKVTFGERIEEGFLLGRVAPCTGPPRALFRMMILHIQNREKKRTHWPSVAIWDRMSHSAGTKLQLPVEKAAVFPIRTVIASGRVFIMNAIPHRGLEPFLQKLG